MNAFMIDQFFSRLRSKWSCQLNQTVSTQNNSSAKMKFLYKWTPRQGKNTMCVNMSTFIFAIRKEKNATEFQ